MKKILYTLLILIPAALTAGDARIERWNSRIDRISKYRDEISRNTGYDPSAAALFTDEIRSAEEFIAILGRYSTGDGSVKAENRKYTVQEIEAFTAETADPVIAVYYSAELIKAAADPLQKNTIKDEINRFAESRGLPTFRKESREAELLANRYILRRYYSGYENSRKKAYADILGITEYELSRTGYNSNSIDLAEIIIKASQKVCASSLNTENVFKESYLTDLPEWKTHVRAADALNMKMNAIITFAESHGTAITPDDRKKGIPHLENLAFLPAKSTLGMMCENTEKAPSTGYNNPVYEIPDFKGILTAIEDIDRYRKSLSVSITGGEGNGFISKVKSNNRGIAERYIRQYDGLYRRERQRIAGLKSRSSATIIYNEEIFNASEKHFSGIREKLLVYADLSSEYIEALYSSWKIDPDRYLSEYGEKAGINLQYISFIERLTADAAAAGKTADAGISNMFKACSRELFTLMKSLYTPEAIPAEVRTAMTRDHIKADAGINENLRIRGSALTVSARKNYEAFLSAYAEGVSSRKSSAIASETSIGQDEVDRLISCAKRYSEYASALSCTSMALKKYSEKYMKITEDIREGRDLSIYLEKINSGSIIPLVDDFSPEKIDREMKLREMLIREGSESLSGAVALMQYYSRRGLTLKYNYTTEDIRLIRESFTAGPEVTVSSWKMNGKNYRLVDTNSTENLRKMINRKAWSPGTGGEQNVLKEKFTPDGKVQFSISLPDGWNRTVVNDDREAALSLSFQSPDLLGKIVLRAVKYDNDNIQFFTDELNRTGGFTPVAREWGKQGGTDFLLTVSKNRYDTVMESYVIKKDGYVIQLSGITDKKMRAVMNKSLKDIFSSLEI